MIDMIALWIGRIIIFLLALSLIGFLSMLIYYLYDIQLKKWLGLDERKAREIVFYYFKHEKEIKDYIENKKKAKLQAMREKK